MPAERLRNLHRSAHPHAYLQLCVRAPPARVCARCAVYCSGTLRDVRLKRRARFGLHAGTRINMRGTWFPPVSRRGDARLCLHERRNRVARVHLGHGDLRNHVNGWWVDEYWVHGAYNARRGRTPTHRRARRQGSAVGDAQVADFTNVLRSGVVSRLHGQISLDAVVLYLSNG